MNVNRYMLIGKEHLAFIETISKWDMKRIVGIAFLFSVLINIGHAFQYALNDQSLLMSYIYAYQLSYPVVNIYYANMNVFFGTFPTLQIFTADFAYFCYILTFATNFLVFFLFNQKFKQTFTRLRHKHSVK